MGSMSLLLYTRLYILDLSEMAVANKLAVHSYLSIYLAMGLLLQVIKEALPSASST